MIREKAETLLKKREVKTREDGSKYVVFNNVTEEEQEAIFKAHLDRLPNDVSYSTIDNILCVIADCEEDDEILERLYEIEPDIYTASLTSWLADDNRNVYYLDEVLQEYGSDLTGFQLLAMAQHKFIIETGETLISVLERGEE